MGKYIELNNSNFEDTTKDGVTFIDFWAPWCGPCRMMTPIVDELSEKYEGKASICKVNTDEEQDLAVKYGVRSIPTLVVLKNGELMETMVGVQSAIAISEKIDAHL
jgi:thioredoxin 1